MGIISKYLNRKLAGAISNIYDTYPGLGAGTDVFGSQFSNGLSTSVTPRAAMQHSAVFACVQLISGVIGSLRLDIVNTDDNSNQNDHYLHYIIDTQPNNLVNAREFWEQCVIDMQLSGRGFAEIIRDKRTRQAKALVRRDDQHVRVKITKGANPRLIYEISDEFGSVRQVNHMDMLHFKNFGCSNYLGETQIQIAGRAIVAGNVEEEFSQKYFASSGLIKDVVEFESEPTTEQIAQFKENFNLNGNEGNAFKKVAVITNGGKHKRLSLSAQDAQTLESRKFSVEQICRIWATPPMLIGISEKSAIAKSVSETFKFWSNIRLNPVLEKMECEIKIKLFPFEKNLEAQFNREGLTKGDLDATTKADVAAVGGNQNPGVQTQNEIRKKRGLAPMADPKADKLYYPIQVVDNMAKGEIEEPDEDETNETDESDDDG